MSTTAGSVAAPLRTRLWLTRLGFILTSVVTASLLMWQLMAYKSAPKVTPPPPQQVQQVASIAECTATSPCTPTMKSDGSTEPVKIKDGERVCFDHSFWDNLPRLGYMTSYRGGAEKRYGCTREQVISGTCNERMGDTFRFVPEPGVSIPKHWFATSGNNC